MKIFYIDSCALVYRYVHGTPSAYVNSVFNDTGCEVFTSSLTLLEWSSALGKIFRKNEITRHEFSLNEQILMKDIANDRLIPIAIKRDIEYARLLIRYIGVINGRKLTSGDALQLVAAKEISYIKRMPVEFITCDANLASVVNDFNVFHPYLNARYLNSI